MIELENRLKDKGRVIDQYKSEIRSLEMVNANQGKQLEKLAESKDSKEEYNNMTNKLKSFKENNKKLDEELREKEKLNTNQHEKLIELETKYRKLQEKFYSKGKKDDLVNI